TGLLVATGLLIATGAGRRAVPGARTIAGAAGRPAGAGAVGAVAQASRATPVGPGQVALVAAWPGRAAGEPVLTFGLAVAAAGVPVHGGAPLVAAVLGLVVEAAGAVRGGRAEPGRVGDPDRLSVFAAQPGLLPLVRQ
ncbi:hypothetical protein I6A62_00785, partial [Frankia sp. AgW1.1]|nr:hypothetical protein [Frankia sp. AgW1.1]